MKRATSILLLVILTIAAWGGEPAKNFTAMEINHIRVKTPGLFSAHKSFSLIWTACKIMSSAFRCRVES